MNAVVGCWVRVVWDIHIAPVFVDQKKNFLSTSAAGSQYTTYISSARSFPLPIYILIFHKAIDVARHGSAAGWVPRRMREIINSGGLRLRLPRTWAIHQQLS